MRYRVQSRSAAFVLFSASLLECQQSASEPEANPARPTVSTPATLTPVTYLQFETGSLTIAVMQSDAFGIEFRANNHPVALHVEDFERARAELASRGVEFKGETLDSGVCYQAFFEDPDGNVLAIHHRYAPQ